MKDLITKLIAIAKQKSSSDNAEFNIYDSCGGNYDDAYYIGCSDGEIGLARQILSDLKVDWKA